MSLAVLPIKDWLAAPAAVDCLIDVRSPSEYADDHLPGAVNWPVLDDAERARVGTIYTQVSTFEARKIGAALVARRIAETLEAHVAGQPRDWQPLVYCWRGGQRSASLALVLAQIGFRTRQLGGGYKAFRGQVRDDLLAWPAGYSWRVLCGRTGSGKTRLLQALAAAGAQVLDLEDLAAHRGSVLGGLPQRAQPSQKRFETLVWQRLADFDPSRPVYAESESRKIGARQVPEALLQAMRRAEYSVRIEMSMAGRVELLLEDYAFLTADVEGLAERLQMLTELRGKAQVQHWQMLARAKDWPSLLPELMKIHYDPLYDRSMAIQFQGLGEAASRRLILADARPQTLADAARQLRDAEPTAPALPQPLSSPASAGRLPQGK